MCFTHQPDNVAWHITKATSLDHSSMTSFSLFIFQTECEQAFKFELQNCKFVNEMPREAKSKTNPKVGESAKNTKKQLTRVSVAQKVNNKSKLIGLIKTRSKRALETDKQTPSKSKRAKTNDIDECFRWVLLKEVTQEQSQVGNLNPIQAAEQIIAHEIESMDSNNNATLLPATPASQNPVVGSTKSLIDTIKRSKASNKINQAKDVKSVPKQKKGELYYSEPPAAGTSN